ncbi:MAG TPA: lipoyl(octanoyl) transferase LipB [Candidatus Acidoferrales bacterium]|nr:lipoyl(octanoyl) transferase LipB [Candidatus Acidoferrales bacterium]
MQPRPPTAKPYTLSIPNQRLRSERSSAPARLLDLGFRPYREVWDVQHELHEAVREGREPDTWIFVEHAPVITLGRAAKRDNVLLSPERLASQGVDLVEIERGGDVTYHGPGQLVVYPIRKLARFREIVPLVRSLEGAVIAAVGRFGIAAERWSDHAGVWVGRNQICAIGLAVQKMVSLHGIALNVSTVLDYDRLINPCGLTDRGITSVSREAGRTVTIDEVKPVLIEELEREFDTELWR